MALRFGWAVLLNLSSIFFVSIIEQLQSLPLASFTLFLVVTKLHTIATHRDGPLEHTYRSLIPTIMPQNLHANDSGESSSPVRMAIGHVVILIVRIRFLVSSPCGAAHKSHWFRDNLSTIWFQPKLQDLLRLRTKTYFNPALGCISIGTSVDSGLLRRQSKHLSCFACCSNLTRNPASIRVYFCSRIWLTTILDVIGPYSGWLLPLPRPLWLKAGAPGFTLTLLQDLLLLLLLRFTRLLQPYPDPIQDLL